MPRRTTTQPATNRSSAAPKRSQLDAAWIILSRAKKAMTCREIVAAMIQKKLWSSPRGKTPEATLYASLLRELAKKGDDARFVKAAPGRFAAKS